IYAYSILLEAALLLALAAADILLPAVQSGPPLVLGLSFIMGLQNAATTKISDARVRTTHVSGMATDIGLGLAALWSARPNSSQAIDRLRLHLSTLTAFLVGGTIGAIGYIAWPELRKARRGS
ncbi:MAG TPA: YoaK family protein, partial [Asticcacaulis sp.]|nr:YoaK family protein [Asticcacaulis sp.]